MARAPFTVAGLLARRLPWTIPFALAVLARPPAAQTTATQDPAPADVSAPSFAKGLAEVHAEMAKSRWPQARNRLLELLLAHERKPWVLTQRAALLHDYTTCRFHEQAEVPEIDRLLGGELLSWSPAGGRIKIAYEDSFADWQGEELLVHPLVFAGTYSVTASGPFYPAIGESLLLFFDLDPSGSDWFVADFGRGGGPASVTRGDGEFRKAIATGNSGVRPSRAFEVELRVTEKSFELRDHRKTILKGRREDARLGRVALRRGSAQKVVLEGRIEPSWLQGRIDEELQQQRAEFEKKFSPRGELPAWLLEESADAQRTEAKEKGVLPGDPVYFSDETDRTIELWQEGKVYEAWEVLRKLQNEDAPTETLTWLETVLLLEAGRGERALPIAERLLTEAPESGLSRLLHARVLDALGRVPEAIDGMRRAVELDPGNPKLYEWLAITVLRHGERDQATAIVRQGKDVHGLVEELAPLDLMLSMAERGPAFAERFVATSAHYEVVSDIDKRASQKACQLLEASYRNLKVQFTWLPDDDAQPKFSVYLFSGKSGYEAYSKAILGAPMPHTAGLYSPVLKQLLIWNLPKREDMERTIVHEGFHQFLDRVMHDPPVWLNEGTAEYWETARRQGGRLTGGQVRRDHLATLSRATKGLPSLENLAYGERADFYANAHLRYAHAWALVHYLRDGGRDNRARFDKLWQALREAGSTRAALDAAFEGLDWIEFEKGFWKYLRELGQSRGR